jgi:uncharacterized protein (TIGR02594 family)
MNSFVKATYHADIKTAEFIADNGRHLLRTGGSLPWRTHNAGNLVAPLLDGLPSPKKTKGYIGFAKAGVSNHHFFIFPDYETGRRELKASLLRKYSDKTLSETIHLYAPSGDHNNTERYISDLSKLSGVATDTKIKDISTEQLNAVMDGIEKIEGYHADADTRKEIWLDVSHIQATDGTRPIAGEEIVVKHDGKETTLKSNAVGQFPPIVHGKGAIEVQHKTVDGKLKSVGQLPADKGQHWSLLTKVAEYFGKTAPVKPTQAPITKKHPVLYTVQPGDNLGKIATKFKLSVAQLKQDNHLARDTILPGQVLGINGAAPATPAPAKPKKAAVKAPTQTTSAPASDSPKPKVKPVPTDENKTVAARSKEGTGEAVALIASEDGVAPWMKYAVAEAKRHKGADEKEIEKSTNYATDVRTGQKTLVGNDHPWCAAFVNWCLMKAGYPIDNEDFYDHVAAKGRAHGFYEVKGKKIDKKDKDAPTVRNPLYVQIDKPVYGAIAMVANSAGHGHHVGFVYAKEGENKMVLLGGNQGNRINFSPFLIKGKKESLMYFLPTAYQAKKDNSDSIPEKSSATLNKESGIVSDSKQAGKTL